MSINWDSLLGGKYVRRNTAPNVASEATGAASEPVEAGEATVEHKPADKPRKGGSGKSGSGAGNRKQA